jgi:iron(III) transport system permease protein
MTTVAGRWPSRRRSRAGRGWPVVVASVLIAAGLLAPLLLVALDVARTGGGELHRVLFRDRSVMLLRNTVVLCAIVATLAAAIGTGAAWLTERAALPARRLWTVLLVLPVAIPDFVVGYAWHSFAPRLAPLAGATIVMTLGTYPLVYLPVAAALRRSDPALEETARGLGSGGVAVFRRVTFPLVRPAVLGGAILVMLTVISEYGAFEVLGYQTFTTEIFTEFQFDAAAAVALSIPLVGLGLLALLAEQLVPRRAVATTAPQRSARRARLGPAAVPTLLALAGLVVLGVGVPIATIAYWMASSQHTTLPATATVLSALGSTVVYSAWGAAIAVVLSVPVAMLTFNRASAARVALERSTYVTKALPGVVIALSLVFFATRYAYGLYETSTLLVIAYAILNFPLALVCVRASVTQISPRLPEVGSSLGRGSIAVFVRVTLPLLAPGLLAGYCLVFVTAATELTATLVLAPIGVQTLSTQFWAFQQNAAYGAAAPYALVMVALALVPGALLGLWFDRERHARSLS